LVEIEIPSNAALHQLQVSHLKKEWWKDFEYSKWIGSEIIKENKVLVIKCPSAVVEMESNYLINPLHSSFKKIAINVVKDFRFDERLFKI
jgi:RES domain-containing protein